MTKFWIKLLLNGIVVFPLLVWFSEATWISAAIVSVVLSIIAYLIGDQLILRASNNIVATLADVGLTFLFIWAAAIMMDWNLLLSEIFIISLLIGVVEYVFHMYLGRADGVQRAAG